MIKELLNPLLSIAPELIIPLGIIASLIIYVIFFFVVRYVMNNINRKVSASIEDEVENKLGVYFVSVVFWPAALVMGSTFLKKPETAKTGRICIIIFLWFSALIILIADITVISAMLYSEEIIEFLGNYDLWQ